MEGQSIKDRASIPPLVKDNATYISNPNKANVLGQQFQEVSSSDNFADTFTFRKSIFETHPNCPSNPHLTQIDMSHSFNEPLTFTELKQALASTANTSPGQDGITYKMLRQLDDVSLSKLLHLYNGIWQSGRLPPSWTHSIVIPVHKKGKPPSSAASYRPISLTSCLCKLEKIVTPRLVWFWKLILL